MTRAEAAREWAEVLARLEDKLGAVLADAYLIAERKPGAAEATADIEANARAAGELLRRARELVAALVGAQ